VDSRDGSKDHRVAETIWKDCPAEMSSRWASHANDTLAQEWAELY